MYRQRGSKKRVKKSHTVALHEILEYSSPRKIYKSGNANITKKNKRSKFVAEKLKLR